MGLFLFEFLLTTICFSVIIASVLIKFDKVDNYSKLEILLYSLGLGPAFTTLILYYSLLLFPRYNSLFYFLIVIFIFVFFLYVGRRYFTVLFKDLKKRINISVESFKKRNILQKIESIFFISLILLLLFSFIFLYLTNTIHTPLEGHDLLHYGMLGKIYFNEKSIDFSGYYPYERTGFYSMASRHAPSFALLNTWEKIINSLIGKENDLFFNSISAYFALLIIFVQFFWLSKKNKYLALLGVLALLSGLRFFVTLITPHLDTYRIFFLMISWIFLARVIKREDLFSLILCGIFSGFLTFTHGIGVIIACINCFTIFVFFRGNFSKKIISSGFVFVLILFFGGIHYLINIVWGTGRIFK